MTMNKNLIERWNRMEQKMKIITVHVGSYLVIQLYDPDPCKSDGSVGGVITEGQLDLSDPTSDKMNALESLILAHACAGVDVSNKEYVDGVRVAIDACMNH